MDALQSLQAELNRQWSHSIVLKRNEFLVKQGMIHTNLYLVEEGSLRIFIENEEEDHTIRFGYRGSLITALDCFITEKPTTFYIQAIKKSTLKVISKKDYLHFINSKEAYKETWNKLLQDLIYQQNEREIDLITHSTKKRVERVFKRSPRLFQEIPQKHIASYLRMTPETLSRILKNLD